MTKDTIAAIATGSVLSAIGIVRLSGSEAITIVRHVFDPANGEDMAKARDRQLVYGSLKDKAGNVIDHCLCTISHGPNSYTGEDTAELQCHGSPVVLREALESLFHAGARQALAGEFTKRAFLNGRMDMTQAEAVIDLIHAETLEAAKNAAGQLGGAMLRKTDHIYSSLIDIASHYHAVLDYPDEEIEAFQMSQYKDTLDHAIDALEGLAASFERGKMMQNGIATAIIGRPNVGKSSLLNALLGYERAIVTEIPGTTRDTIEAKVRFGEIVLQMSDTAGLRTSEDVVEQLGIARTKQAIAESELILCVFDASAPFTSEDIAVRNACQNAKHKIALLNKSDLENQLDQRQLEDAFSHIISVSAKDGTGLTALEETIKTLFPMPEEMIYGEILTNARQAEAIRHSLQALQSAQEAIMDKITPDAVLSEIERAMECLAEFSGKMMREDVTTRIFERFCVGK